MIGMRRISAGSWLDSGRGIGWLYGLMATCAALAAWKAIHHDDFVPLAVTLTSISSLIVSMSARLQNSRSRGLFDAAWIDGDVLLLRLAGRVKRIAMTDIDTVQTNAPGASISLLPRRAVFQLSLREPGRADEPLRFAVAARRADALAAELRQCVAMAKCHDGR